MHFGLSRHGYIGPDSPVCGPQALYYEIVAPWPRCTDRRAQAWRLVSYQARERARSGDARNRFLPLFVVHLAEGPRPPSDDARARARARDQFVHAGYSHLLGNVLLQLLFGLPIELVHGPLRVGVIYTFGVACGALACAVFDPYSSVGGASGGVYCVYGVHIANLVLNFSEMRHGLSNHWLQLLGLVLFNALEAFYYIYFPQENLSYAAHAGGWAAGVAFGLVCLQSVQQKRWMFIVRVLASVVFWGCFLFSLGWYAFTFPPDFYTSRVTIHGADTKPCCWHAWDCALAHPGGFERADFARFSCVHTSSADEAEYKLASINRQEVFDSCKQYRAYISNSTT